MPRSIQPTDEERLTKCTNVYVIGRACPDCYWNGIHWCHATETTARPLGCPTAERSREAYNHALQARRIAIGKSPYSLVSRHRKPEEAEINENDAQTICFDCEPTHQLSCLCFGQNGVPDDCKTYNARRAIVEGEPTSRYDIHVSGLSNEGIEVRIEVPMMAVEEE